jgi:hypothetical protein
MINPKAISREWFIGFYLRSAAAYRRDGMNYYRGLILNHPPALKKVQSKTKYKLKKFG